MQVVTAKDLGALVRERRKQRRMSQEDLAHAVGVSRQWIIGLEQGRVRALGNVFRTLAVLGLAIDVVEESHSRPVDLDEHLARYEGAR